MTNEEIEELELLLKAAHSEAERQVARLESRKSGVPSEPISETAAWLERLLSGKEPVEPPSDDFARRMAVILSGHSTPPK